MIGAIAGQQGFDPKGKTGASTGIVGTPGTTYSDVLNILGSGYLVGMIIACGGTDGKHYTRLVVDGVVLWDKQDSASGYGGQGQTLMIRFNTSLQIQHRHQTYGWTNATYLLD